MIRPPSECPVCYESFEDDQTEPCSRCNQRICQGCVQSIRRSSAIVTACPLCRNVWKPLQSSDTLAEWRRRLRLTQQVAQWVVPPVAALAADPFAPDSTTAVIATAQAILMGVWFWAHV